MLEKIKALQQEIATVKASSLEDVDALRIKYISKKGEVSQLFAEFKSVPPELKKEVGKAINDLKLLAQERINQLRETFESGLEEGAGTDLTRPGESMKLGARHPLAVIRNEIIDIFGQIGFTVAEGPEIEDDWHNFTALNIPQWHPARDIQDTFYIKHKRDDDKKTLLRTHTSPLQIRSMLKKGVPLRIIAPGRVYRNEATDARHETTFWQVEGLYVDKGVSIDNLIAVLNKAIKMVLGKDVKIRWRPGYFPFVEPGVEIDIECLLCSGKGCGVCKDTGWLEFSGAGMVHPNVLKAVDIDPDIWSGYAFGFGLTRLAMLKWGIDDVRLFLSGDLRFLKQFKK